MRAYHSLSAAEVLSALQTSEVGIGEAEAARRLQQYGENALPSAKRAAPSACFWGSSRTL